MTCSIPLQAEDVGAESHWQQDGWFIQQYAEAVRKVSGSLFAKQGKCDSIGGMRRKSAAPVFKRYVMNQVALMPPSYEEKIPADHLVRVVNEAVEQIDLSSLLAQYPGGGRSSYHQKMLLKVLVYGYVGKIYSSRRIAKALRENIYFMWISEESTPDFRTINDFRGSRMKGVIDEVFSAVPEHLMAAGHVKLEHYFTDGTKIEADANKHKVVWAKKRETYHQRVQAQIKDLLKQNEKANEAEQDKYGDDDLEEMGGNEQTDVNSEKSFAVIAEGLRYIFSSRLILSLTGAVGLVNVFCFGLLNLLPAWVTDVLHGDEITNGLLFSARGLGALICALILASLVKFKIRGKLWITGFLVTPVALFILTLVRWIPLSLIIMVVIGWSMMMTTNNANAMIQSEVPNALRGRVTSFIVLVFNGAIPIGALLGGVAVEYVGAPLTIMVSALILLFFALVAWFYFPDIRRQV